MRRGARRRTSHAGSRRMLAWTPAVVTVTATVAYGSVHAPIRAVVCALLCAWAIWCLSTRRSAAGSLAWSRVMWSLAAALAVAFSLILPVPGAIHDALIPDLARLSPLAGVHGWRPLAPDPGAATRGLAVMCSLWLAMCAAMDVRVRPRHLLAAVVAGGVCTAVVGLLGAGIGLGTPFGLERGRGVTWFGPFISANHAGALLACSSAAAGFAGLRDRRWQYGWWAASLLCFAGVALCHSRGALLHWLVGMGAGAWVHWRGPRGKLGLVVAFGVPVAVLLMPEAWLQAYSYVMDPLHVGAEVFGGRGTLLGPSVQLVRTSPALGLGPGGFATAYRTLFSEPLYVDLPHAHNEWVQVAVEYGVFGVLALLFVLGAWFREVSGEQAHGFVASTVAGAAALASAATIDFPLRSLAIALAAAWLIVLPFKGPSVTTKPWSVPALGLALVLGLAGHIGWGAYGRADVSYRAARTAFAAEDFPLAELAIQEGLTRRALDGRLWNLGAWVAYKDGHPEVALARLQTASKITPHLPGPWLGLARMHIELEDFSAADEAYAVLLELDLPPGTEDQVIREVYQVRGYDPTLRALTLWPTRPDRQCAMALELARRGEPESARLLMDSEARRYCRSRWAEWLLHDGQHEAAFQEVGALSGCTADRIAGIALVALDDSRALARLESAMRSCERKTLTLRVSLGQARLKAGDADGIGIIEAAVRDHPDAVWARRALIRALRERGLGERARPHLEYLEQQQEQQRRSP